LEKDILMQNADDITLKDASRDKYFQKMKVIFDPVKEEPSVESKALLDKLYNAPDEKKFQNILANN
jgi:hypothetical protein